MNNMVSAIFLILIHSIPSFIGYKILKYDIKNNKNITLSIIFSILSIIPIVMCFYFFTNVREYAVLSFISGPLIMILSMVGIIIYINKTDKKDKIILSSMHNKLNQNSYKKFKFKDLLVMIIVLIFIGLLIN